MRLFTFCEIRKSRPHLRHHWPINLIKNDFTHSVQYSSRVILIICIFTAHESAFDSKPENFNARASSHSWSYTQHKIGTSHVENDRKFNTSFSLKSLCASVAAACCCCCCCSCCCCISAGVGYLRYLLFSKTTGNQTIIVF